MTKVANESQPESASSYRRASISSTISLLESAHEPNGDQTSIEQALEDDSLLPDDDTAVDVKEHWNKPRINGARLAAVFLTFLNLGIHAASFGPVIPLLEEFYGLGYTTVSLLFLASLPGSILAAISGDWLHLRVGRRGIAAFGSSIRVAAYIGIACHPPWSAILILLVFCGWGNGLLDSGWNTWTSSLYRPNELLGFIHAVFGLGAAVGPLIASVVVNTYRFKWYEFYYIPLGLTCMELVVGTSAFWSDNGPEFRRKNAVDGKISGRLTAALKQKVTWIVAIFLLLYVGAEVALSGWVVVFMIRVRKASPLYSSLTSTGFWVGITVGRLSLGFVTARFGERWSIAGYLVLTIGLELVFWLVPHSVVSALAIALMGFFLGPMFPAAIIAISKLLPKHLHVGAISFAGAVGVAGAAVLPFAVGAIASSAGVQVLQPFILAVLALLLALWLLMPKIPRSIHNR